jgi:hypothetical protein
VTKEFEPYQREYENANDLDFEESLDKNRSTSISNDETIKTSSTKQSLFVFFISKNV